MKEQTDNFLYWLLIALFLLLCTVLNGLVGAKQIIDKQALIISGNEATIASYKESLTECLKDNKLSGQDEFTGE